MRNRPAKPARLVFENGAWEVWNGDVFVEAFASRADAVVCLDGLK